MAALSPGSTPEPVRTQHPERERYVLPLPPLLAGAVLLFWGWQNELWLWGMGTALCLEAARRLRPGFAFQALEFGRMADLCVLLFLGQALYLALIPEDEPVLLRLVQWLPLTLLPMALAEAASESRTTTLLALFGALRRKRTLAQRKPLVFSFLPLYAVLCLFAAGAANTRSDLFFPAMGLIFAWWLWGLRPRRYHAAKWALALVVVLLLAYGGQWSIHEVQKLVRSWARADPFKRSTALGAIGELKGSGRIVLRVASEQPLPSGFLLREATYDFLSGETWHATNAEFSPLDAPGDTQGLGAWALRDASGEAEAPRRRAIVAAPRRELRIYQQFWRRLGMLPAPLGSLSLRELPVGRVEQNRYAGLIVIRPPGLVGYLAEYAPGLSLDAPPGVVERIVGPADRPFLEGIVTALGLARHTPEERLALIQRYFFANYAYSLKLARQHPELSPLREFMEHSRAGHCEYFATAAVFLLRQAGIPSRYAAGYAVHEFSADESLYVVRERHAHSWALAYVEGRWVELDVTPPNWAEDEAGEYGLAERLADLRQRLSFAFARWRWLGQDAALKRALLWVALPLLGFLGLRIARQLRLRRRKAERAAAVGERVFAAVEQHLATRGLVRGAGEPWGQFLERAGALDLLPALQLYYRERFDPAGLDPAGRAELRSLVDAWLRGASGTRATRGSGPI